jgi:4'-phosphopantetheinyl transferase
MAIIYSEKFGKARLSLWKITEEEDKLLSLAGLSARDLETFSAFKATQRRKEWLAVRALLRNMLNKPSPIGYHCDGRPFLEDSSQSISISHTKGYAAILLNDEEIPGLDIELETRSAEKVAPRILNPEELESSRDGEGYSNKKLLIHWCAKETVFKMVPDHNVSYLNHIRISLNPPLSLPHSFEGLYLSETGNIHFDLFYQSVEGLIMVWGWPSPA